MREADFQSKVIRWLRREGCFVWKCKQDATTQRGVSDLFFCYEGFYGFLEIKAYKGAKFQAGQKEFVEKMDAWSYARVVYPENWGKIQEELKEILQ